MHYNTVGVSTTTRRQRGFLS